MDFLRLRFEIFIREPVLLFYATVYIGSLIVKMLALVFISAVSVIHKKDSEETLAIRSPKGNWAVFIIPFVIFAVLARLYHASNPLVPNLPIRLVFPESMIIGNAIIIFSVLLIAPIAEEIIFRGYMFGVIGKAFGPYSAVAATSLVFAAAHLHQLDFQPVDCGIILALGVFFGIMRLRSGSILIPVFYHFLYNAVGVSVGVVNYFIAGY